ncbi:Acetamidase/Formamidase [Cynara cardunculus var. scolymus]|uniref:Acetamidase/Formamidase n=1 Tax=Cynara cardunculus var. scolymus TaxID=59895 RepID=A0A118K5E5_CYNCS|nr:Acetamidase/Formamidase [Cynara cardunculus var. scolymus]
MSPRNQPNRNSPFTTAGTPIYHQLPRLALVSFFESRWWTFLEAGSHENTPPTISNTLTSRFHRHSNNSSSMAPSTPRLVVPVDLKKKPWEQKLPLHNRWHPEIPSVAEVKTGEFFRIDMVDCTGGAIKDDDSATDVKHADHSTVHYLSGPIRVVDEEGIPANPGDLLAVEICNLGPLPGEEWGFTAIFDRENGGGFLTDHFPCATKAIWYFEGIYAYSPHIPGVRFPGLTHPGIIGTAPSMELLNIWNERERELEENGLKSFKLCEVLHSRPLANLPSTKGCLLGKIPERSREWEKIANEAARTIPGRENGGNCDIKNLSRGSKIYLPVFVEGANFSTGDMHFSQGDGEVSFCGAIEMSGFLELKCEIIRGGMKEYLTPMGPTPLHVNPIFEIGPVEPRFSEWLVFEGISVDESGRQHYLDASVAYKRRISGIVDAPNAVATLAIPTAIFDQDIRPKRNKLPVGPRVVRNPNIPRCSYDGNLPITKNPGATGS